MLIAECAGCGLRSYPAPLMCSRCRDTELTWLEIREAIVVEATQSPEAGFAIATVTGRGGPFMVACVPAGAGPGDELELADVDSPGRAFVPRDLRAPID